MNINNISISYQLKIGFALILFFVVVLGVISHYQTDEIFKQTELIYNHPLQVRTAIGKLNADILQMRLSNRELLLAKNQDERFTALQSMEVSAKDAEFQFEILKQKYLGNSQDVTDALNAFISWKTARQNNTKLALAGEIDSVLQSVSSTGKVGSLRDSMMKKIAIIEIFAKGKAKNLITTSEKLNQTLAIQLLIIVVIILTISIVLTNIILRNIRKPLKELLSTSERFQKGDLSARSKYNYDNEFGELSDSFNKLAEVIQSNTDLQNQASNLAKVMLEDDDSHIFFKKILKSLSIITNSQIAAVYIRNESKNQFELFESIGINNNAENKFSADTYEGEFGIVLSTLKIQHIKNIPSDTRFIYKSASGNYIPNEIITIPILAGNEVIAIISIANISKYDSQSLKLIENIQDTLSARIEGILAYQKIKEFTAKLEIQNTELESQKSELSAQSSELIEQNTELEIQKNQLNEASRLKTNFLSNMSHELRTPLNSVIALSGVLNRRLNKVIPDEEYSYLEIIERNGKHLLSLINDILDISRIEAGREEIEITNFDLSNLINDIINMIKPQAKQKGIDLIFAKDDKNLIVNTDSDKCSHILQNLVSNAVKFTEKGKVEVKTHCYDSFIDISVIDTGIGISDTNVNHIFDEFRQADGSTSRRYGGSGLGLAIAKKYSNLLGGTISVNSTPDIGSEFILKLPVNYVAENRITGSELVYETKNNFIIEDKQNIENIIGKTILLVEDSEPAIIQLKDILLDSGYNILVAHNGSEALNIISNTIPDAMVLDLMMPGIDGFEVLKSIREIDLTSHIPVLVLTAKHISKEELKLLKRNNIHQLIQKGDVKRIELLDSVARMVSNQIDNPEKLTSSKIQKFDTKPSILVVEDNPDNMITVKAILSDLYIVYEATDGYSGIEAAQKYKPNLILMDIALPGIDGIKAFQEIRKNPNLQHIPVIALTASAMTTDRELILAYGLDGYIAKPIDEKVFFKTINSVLYGK
jgi:signal transduction histidine kinase/CheY-like chemotaxis protein/CHASE3 domain sensor protein